MRWLRRLFRVSRWSPGSIVRPCRLERRVRPHLEALEDRTLLNNRFVLPYSVPVDNATTFRSLEAALTTAGLNPGDVIEIEPGSSPGNIVNADLPAVTNLTIQGNPEVSLLETPSFVVNDAITIVSGQDGFALRNVNVILQGGGLTFDVNGTIVTSTITNNFAGTAVTLNGTTAAAITNSQIVAYNGVASGQVIQVTTASKSNNFISGNTIAGTGTTAYNLLSYVGANPVSDDVANNVFDGNNQSTAPLVVIGTGINGLGIHSNSFNDSTGGQTGLVISANDKNIVVVGNGFGVRGGLGTHGVEVSGGSSGVTSATFALNRFNTGNGIGLVITPGGSGSTLNVKVEASDFSNNRIGVEVLAGSGGSVAGIDLGGGSQGSLGGINFRGFTSAATTTSGAIVTSAAAAAGVISAQKNIFSVPDPETVIFDFNDNSALADVDPTGNLTGNAAYVQTLYIKFLHRVGDTSNPTDAGFWVNLLNNNVSSFTVANAIVRSPESLAALVNELYRRYLNRAADPAGKAAFVQLLENGGTLEQVSDSLLSSAEYNTLYGSNGSYVLSLYFNLLRRMPSPSELTGFMAAIPILGRPAVANVFLHSPEYRTIIITGYYTTLLNRGNPTPTEVATWANSSFDLLSIQVVFAASPEFQTNG
jgi:hypothetical protein